MLRRANIISLTEPNETKRIRNENHSPSTCAEVIESKKIDTGLKIE